MLYFAYGSNMCTGRLQQRVPSANPVRIAKLLNHSLNFHKRSNDGSGKCDACFTGEPADVVWGVIFKIDPAQKPHLDAHEGLGHGYAEKLALVIDEEGNRYSVFTYTAGTATLIRRSDLIPGTSGLSSRAHVNKLSRPDYIARIEVIPTTEDSDKNRDAANRGIFVQTAR
jgi:gamma-glutamylcyclotransferase